MAALLFARDPFGRWVPLEDSLWFTKICRGHPYMRSQLAAVRAAIIQPDEITTDRLHLNRECYYLSGVLTGQLERNYIRVVVSFQYEVAFGAAGGFIVTAHPIPRVHPKEQHKWP